MRYLLSMGSCDVLTSISTDTKCTHSVKLRPFLRTTSNKVVDTKYTIKI